MFAALVWCVATVGVYAVQSGSPSDRLVDKLEAGGRSDRGHPCLFSSLYSSRLPCCHCIAVTMDSLGRLADNLPSSTASLALAEAELTSAFKSSALAITQLLKASQKTSKKGEQQQQQLCTCGCWQTG